MKILKKLSGGVNSSKSTTYTLNSLPSAIILALALSLTACEKVEYGDEYAEDPTRTSVSENNDSTSTNEADGFAVSVSDEDWEDVDGGNY